MRVLKPNIFLYGIKKRGELYKTHPLITKTILPQNERLFFKPSFIFYIITIFDKVKLKK